ARGRPTRPRGARGGDRASDRQPGRSRGDGPARAGGRRAPLQLGSGGRAAARPLRRARMSRLTVLHAGPLDSVHVARWAEMTRTLGHRSVVAGHLRPGLAQAPMAGPVHRAPQLPWASTRRAQTTGRLRHRAAAALPNAVVEARLWARWLRRLAAIVLPDVIHAHWLPGWPAAAALARVGPTVAGPMGSDVY